MSVLRLLGHAREDRVWRRLVGPRPVLVLGSAVVLLALLGGFTYVVLDSLVQSRKETEKRFGAEAVISAQLASSIFTTSARTGQAAAAKAFGGATVDVNVLTSFAKRSGWTYALILDRHGEVLAASRGTPAAVRLGRGDAVHVRRALEGRPSLSDILPVGAGRERTLEWAVPFETPFGRRVQVEALSPTLIFNFLSGYLRQPDGNAERHAYVLDSGKRIVGAAGFPAKPGDALDERGLVAATGTRTHGTYGQSGVERYFASAPVQGSTWRVVLSEQTSQLYPPLAGSKSWFLFALLASFGLAGAIGLLFFRRALRNGAELAATNSELRELNVTLEERVAERTAAAEEHARELARSNVELEQFSSVASHDLQEPLRKIRMFGDRLRTRLGDDLSEEPAADLERMQNAAQRMQRLIDDLLDFSRVTHRGREFERVDLGEVTREVLLDLEARVLELDATVDVTGLPVIEADRTQMRQLLQNLVGNALKFHREGEAPRIRIRGEIIAGQPPRFSGEATTGERCVLTVADNGIGFEEKYAERVFTAFERLHSRSSYDGTGIGLSIARKIVWRHGGDITATSAPGEGATFSVTLPVSHRKDRNAREGGTRIE
jgi:signal transduction histidine kinase